jgi:hypothetical protein
VGGQGGEQRGGEEDEGRGQTAHGAVSVRSVDERMLAKS